MTDLKELIEKEIDQYLEWPTADKSHVTVVSAKLFAEHVAQLYADHIRGVAKKISRPQIREVFLRNGFTIKPGCDDLRDYVYKAAFELLEMAAPAEHGEPSTDIVEALRQYQHNDGSGIVFGYDKEVVDRHIERLQQTECEKLRRDAERYRFLRADALSAFEDGLDEPQLVFACECTGDYQDCIDDAVDDAMEEAQS